MLPLTDRGNNGIKTSEKQEQEKITSDILHNCYEQECGSGAYCG